MNIFIDVTNSIENLPLYRVVPPPQFRCKLEIMKIAIPPTPMSFSRP